MTFRTKTALVVTAILTGIVTLVAQAVGLSAADAAVPAPAPTTGTVSFDSDSYMVNEADGTVTLTLVRAGGSIGVITVELTTADGTAVAGADYAGLAVPLTVAWADGADGARTVDLPILPDVVTEPNETFTATIMATNVAWLGAPTTSTVTIVDDPTGTVSFDSDSYVVNEADGVVTMTLVRAGGTAGILTVELTTADGTAINGVDYAGLAVPLTVAWPDGADGARTIDLPILPDLVTEPDETFTATIAASNAGWLGTPTTSTVTIAGTVPVTPTVVPPMPSVTPVPPVMPTPMPTPGPGTTPVPVVTPAPGPAPLSTPTPTPDPIAGPLASGAISSDVQGDTVVLTIPASLAVWLDPAGSVTVTRNPVVFDGPLPASRTISFPLNGVVQPFDVTFAATIRNGAAYSEVVSVTPPPPGSALPHVQAVPTADGQPEPGARIILDAPTELAHTGSRTTHLLILTGILLAVGTACVVYSNDLFRKSRFTF